MSGGVPELTVLSLMKELKRLTDPIRFGTFLGFPEHEMEIIRRDNIHETNEQKYALYTKISRNYRSMRITWDKIADALDELGDEDLALEIRRKFCKMEKTADHRIDEIALKVGVDPKTLDKPCDSDTQLLQISKLLEHWPTYAPYLGLTEQELNAIQTDETLTAYYMRPNKMLVRWQEKKAYSSEASYRFLLRGCLKINDNARLVGDICKLLLK